MAEQNNSENNQEIEAVIVEENNDTEVVIVDELLESAEVEQAIPSENQDLPVDDLEELLALGEEVFDLDIETAAGEASDGGSSSAVEFARDGKETIVTTAFDTSSLNRVEAVGQGFEDLNVNLEIPTLLNLIDGFAIEDTTTAGTVISSFTYSGVAELAVDFVAGTNDNGYYELDGTDIKLTTAGEEFLDAGNELPNISLTTSNGITAKNTVTTQLVNDKSVLLADDNTNNEDNTVTGNVLANDSDVDDVLTVSSFTIAGDDTTYTVTENDDGTVEPVNVTETITVSNSDGSETTSTVMVGSITFAVDGSYTFTPTEDWSGAVPQISYTTNTDSTSTLDLTVKAVADKPTLSLTETVTINADNYGEVTDGKVSSGNGYTLTGYSHFVGINSTDNELGEFTSVTGTNHDGIGVNAKTTIASDPYSEIGADAKQSEALVIELVNDGS